MILPVMLPVTEAVGEAGCGAVGDSGDVVLKDLTIYFTRKKISYIVQRSVFGSEMMKFASFDQVDCTTQDF